MNGVVECLEVPPERAKVDPEPESRREAGRSASTVGCVVEKVRQSLALRPLHRKVGKQRPSHLSQKPRHRKHGR